MSDTRERPTQFTLTDIDVGCRLYEALVRHATSAAGASITYDDLLTLARKLHPRDAVLGRAVAVGIGMKLFFVQRVCKANNCPDLSSLAVSPATMRPRSDYKGDWEADRRAVAGFDWPAVEAKRLVFADAMRAAVPKRFKARAERPADVAWYAYFCAHRAACATVDMEDKKEIINLLMAGLDPETALCQVLAAKADFGNAP